ncbi:MAG: GAF domain-containing protein [bacterium]
MSNRYSALIQSVTEIIGTAQETDTMLQNICDYLREEVEEFDWAGFYLTDSEEADTLKLGPFAGEPTEHKKIKFGDGICGQAAVTLKTFIIQDVSSEDNYLSCSPEVNAEIVVPIFSNGEFTAELDIDSHQKNAITPAHKKLCEEIAELLRDKL